MKKTAKSLAVVMMVGVASISMAGPKIEVNHHNDSFKGVVKSNVHNANYNGNKNANYNGNKNSNSNKNSNYNKASNYSNNKASASNYNHSYTSSDSKAKSNSQAKSNSGSYSGSYSGGSKSGAYSGGSDSEAYNAGNEVNVEGDEYYSEGDDYDFPANSVPVSIGGICTDAAAAQGMNGGVSISRANPVCEKLKMYEVYMKLGMKEEALKSLKDAEALSDVRAFFRGTLTVLTLGIL